MTAPPFPPGPPRQQGFMAMNKKNIIMAITTERGGEIKDRERETLFLLVCLNINILYEKRWDELKQMTKTMYECK